MRILISLILLSLAASAAAQQGQVRYVSDELSITLRKSRGADSAVSGLLSSGTRVEILETDAASGYARVSAGPGREGWVLLRYLIDEPVARARLSRLQSQFDDQQAALAQLERDNERLRAQLELYTATDGASADPAPAAVEAPIKAPPPEPEAERAHAPPETSAESLRVKSWIVGAMILAVGLLLGLVAPTISSPRRREWTDL